jgi:hypothetical protein
VGFACSLQLTGNFFCLNTGGEFNPHTLLRIYAAWPKLTEKLLVSIRAFADEIRVLRIPIMAGGILPPIYGDMSSSHIFHKKVCFYLQVYHSLV